MSDDFDYEVVRQKALAEQRQKGYKPPATYHAEPLKEIRTPMACTQRWPGRCYEPVCVGCKYFRADADSIVGLGVHREGQGD